MSDEIKKYLADILKSIHYIESFVDKQLTFFVYQKDAKTKFAVERNLEIIGEAMSQALKLEPSLPVASARKIVDLRNRIIHAYDSTDDFVIWEVIQTHIPVLKMEVSALMENE